MDGQPPPRPPAQCVATVTLTEAERRRLNTLPQPQHVAGWHLRCALEDAHHGPHYACGQRDGGGHEHWVRWEERHLGQLEIIETIGCPDRTEAGGACLLFTGHPGAHHLSGQDWNTRTEAPPPAPARSHADYLAHRRAALTSATTETAQLHASLALAAATNRLADLLETRDHR